MAYLTSQLISDAYYLSGIVSRGFETVTGDQSTDGLRLLNNIIADRTIDEATIPYTEKLDLTASAGLSNYFIENLIDCDVFVFYIGSVRYETNKQSRFEFFGSYRAAIQSLPFNFHFERELGGARLNLYPIPSANFPMEIWGSFRLAAVTMFQDLSLTLDQFYTNFLQYLLTDRLCQFYGYIVPQGVAKQLEEYYKWINGNTNVIDFSMKKISSLGNGGGINYGIVNLSGGWTVPSS